MNNINSFHEYLLQLWLLLLLLLYIVGSPLLVKTRFRRFNFLVIELNWKMIATEILQLFSFIFILVGVKNSLISFLCLFFLLLSNLLQVLTHLFLNLTNWESITIINYYYLLFLKFLDFNTRQAPNKSNFSVINKN